ncbi:acetyl-CoA carboxylase biotin carboxyl carrier protein [Peptostreptococcus faecalis]|uniref:acetyl-CoA carboxylase biotin carboxyl carrier protein n=1 Tax=Peptostreptococcus faecalis TaxID=2045015 RepID=UPI000C7B338C|nr:acetyl-CoA carboxylase biotin carboxyl carrier protein [Peptostreptococcus faecalis]
MEIKFIKQLALIMEESGLEELDYHDESGKIKLKKKNKSKFKRNNLKCQNKKEINYDENIENTGEDIRIDEEACVDSESEKKENLSKIDSNIIGTFYDKPSPDEQKFVNKGDIAKKGDVLCIIESMKLMNEIKAPYDCEVVNILVQDQEIVEFGQTLFEVKEI